MILVTITKDKYFLKARQNMNNKKTLNRFLTILDFWETELDHYDFNQLTRKEKPESWSMGQLYQHLIDGTLRSHLQQVNQCLKSSENKKENKNLQAFVSYFIINGFPPIKIKIQASEEYTPKQPDSVNEIKMGLRKVKQEMERTLEKFKTDKKGKTLLPGFSYLNAEEWYRLILLHFKHHLRQKQRLDAFLNKSENDK
ncbi:MAG: hypothetical protein COA49_03995 [Bacteroidetes bacterium]|nr:MAG: hypothetical protein COA49_03995 [Bacteroidota bacterium]